MIINNFAHDLFTGFWTSSILIIYLLRERAHATTVIAAELHVIIIWFFWLEVISLAIVLATGGFRFLYYKPVSDDSEKTRKSLLIAKHLLFSVIFAGGAFLAYRWTFS